VHALNRWILLACALTACKKHDESLAKPSDREADFAAQLKTAIGRDLTFDEANHRLTGSNEAISTTNLYQEWVATAPADRPEAIKKIAAGFAQAHGDTADAAKVRPQLRPAVRAVSYFDPSQITRLAAGMGSAASTTKIPFVALGAGAGAAVAIDSPDSMSIATDKQLADWKMSIDDALAIAVANLRADGAHLEQLEPGVWGAKTGDSYDASRIVLVDDIRKLNLPGGAVALIPNRETLLLAGAKDARGLLAMAARAEAVEADPRPIHTVALCLGDAGWSDCVPDVTPEVQNKFSELAARGWISLYGDTHDAYQDELGDDLFVAHLAGMKKQGGVSVSYATWTKTVPTMLPKADLIAFVVLEGPEGKEKGKMLGLARWDRVMAAFGSHLKETGRLPRYWATGDWFPSDAELAKLPLEQKP